jgi:hypothetical protein
MSQYISSLKQKAATRQPSLTHISLTAPTTPPAVLLERRS